MTKEEFIHKYEGRFNPNDFEIFLKDVEELINEEQKKVVCRA